MTRVLSLKKILEIEDRHEEDRNAFTTKIESLEMGVKVAEMKAKSAQDHGKIILIIIITLL